MSDAPEEKPKPRRRWRRWRRWIGALLVLLTGLLLWLNGPGARWILTKVIHQQLEKQQLSGSFEVQGNLHSGLSLHKIDLTGQSIIQKARSRLVKIEWSLSSLLNKQIQGLSVDQLHLVIDPKAPPIEKPEEPEEESEPSDPDALKNTLELVRNLLQPATIRITDVHVEVRDITTVSLASLSHQPGTDAFLFENLAGTDHLGRPLNNPSSTLSWTSEGFHLDRFAPLPTLAIRDLSFAPGGELNAQLLVDDALFSLKSDLSIDHSLVLESPALDLQGVAQLATPDLPLRGIITDLSIETSTGQIRLKGKDLQWEDQKLAFATIETRSPKLTQPFGQPIKFNVNLEERLQASGTVTLQEEILDSSADFTFSLSDPRIPDVTGGITYHSREAKVSASALENLAVNGIYFVDSSTYEATANANLTDSSVLDSHLTGPLKFSLSGSGSIPDQTHTGKLDLGALSLNQPNLPSATAQGEITWNWPEDVQIERLQMDSSEGQLSAKAGWSDDTLTIDQLSLAEAGIQLLTATGRLPAPLKMPPLEEFLQSEAPVSLIIKSQPLTFETLATYAPLPETMSGVVQADLELTGSLARPTLNGFTTLDDFTLSTQPSIPPTSLRLEFNTEQQKLLLTAKAREPGGELLDLNGELPFLPRAWINRKSNPIDSPVKLSAITPDIDLKRILPFVPMIRSVDGIVKINAQVSGTLAEPTYSGNVTLRANSMRLDEGPLSNIRNVNIRASAAGTTVTIAPSSAEASGGKVNLGGSVELGGTEPVFDIFVKGSYFLLNRTEDYTIRGNPDLKLRGPYSSATISGSVGLVESLIYKDIEILPLGKPTTSEIPKPNLPTFTDKPTTDIDSSPDESSGGFKNWKLDLNVVTSDPILIRGNLAEGEISGKIKVFGTIDDPKTSGTLSADKLVLDLPFSDLIAQSAVVTLRPDALTNPFINLRGSSKVGEYEVQVFLSGPVHNPELVLTSDPPLPDSEIMLLLATGSASDQLEDQEVASQKALQYLLEGIRRRNGDKDKTVLQRLIKNSDQIDFSLGDTDQFSGRKYSSASLDINDRWDFTTQIDDEGNTRALVVFSIRFR